MTPRWALWLLHWSALAPLIYLIVWRRDSSRACYLIALAFSVSAFADLVLRMCPEINWAVTHYYPVVQLSLFALASSYVGGLVVFLAGFPWLVYAYMNGLTGPDVLFTGIGSIIVIWETHSQRWSKVIYIYCGVATLFYLALATEIDNGWFMPLWWGYQLSRLTAFGVFIAYVERQRGLSESVSTVRDDAGAARFGADRDHRRVRTGHVSADRRGR